MKKILLTSFCAVAFSAASFGQGYVNWSAITPTYLSAQTNGTVYSSLSATLGGGQAITGSTAANQGNTVASSAGLTYYFESALRCQWHCSPNYVERSFQLDCDWPNRAK